jgi:LytS/YehU family sensor histidine kinase
LSRTKKDSFHAVTSSSHDRKGGFTHSDIDFLTRTSKVLFGQLDPVKLARGILEFAAEATGAHRGMLLLQRHGMLCAEAEWVENGSYTYLAEAVPIERTNYIAAQQFIYQAVRSPGLIFSAETVSTGAVLCLPLVHQGRLEGVLYVETRRLKKITRAKRGLLELLSTQTTISLINARNFKTRLEAEQAKVNPHFLFNALSSIANLVHVDPGTAETSIVALSHLYRYILTTSAGSLVSMEQELGVVTAYLRLEKLRFGNRLEFEVATRGDIGRVRLPGMLIQPLVENSIRHGIAPLLGQGRVNVNVEAEQERCRIAVEDNGDASSSSSSGTGFGLKSVQERLSLVYGDDYSMEISRSHGYRVVITIPILQKE